MNPNTAYQFLKPSLEKLTPEQKEELCRLINGEPKTKKAKPSKKADPIMSKAKMKKLLLKSHFKSRA